MAYIGGALATIIGFVLGLVVMGIWMRRKLLALSKNPDHPVFKDILPTIMDTVAPFYKGAANVAEQYGQATGCGCGHQIAEAILHAIPMAEATPLKTEQR